MRAYVYHIYIYTQLCDLSLDILNSLRVHLGASRATWSWSWQSKAGCGDVSQVDFFFRWTKKGVLDPNAQIKQPPKTAGFLSKHLTFSIQISGEKKNSQIVEINIMHNTSDL